MYPSSYATVTDGIVIVVVTGGDTMKSQKNKEIALTLKYEHEDGHLSEPSQYSSMYI